MLWKLQFFASFYDITFMNFNTKKIKLNIYTAKCNPISLFRKQKDCNNGRTGVAIRHPSNIYILI